MKNIKEENQRRWLKVYKKFEKIYSFNSLDELKTSIKLLKKQDSLAFCMYHGLSLDDTKLIKQCRNFNSLRKALKLKTELEAKEEYEKAKAMILRADRILILSDYHTLKFSKAEKIANLCNYLFPEFNVDSRFGAFNANNLILTIIKNLSKDERKVVRLYFGLDDHSKRSADEVSHKLNMESKEVFSLLNSSVSKLRKKSSNYLNKKI